jgi:preprotein translocase subunit SecY
MTTSKNQIIKELLISISLIAVYRLMLMIPMPFIDLKEFNSFSETIGGLFIDNDYLSHISITAMGIMPFVSAYLMVEIFSLILPFLKKHRTGEYRGRKILKTYALGLTLILSLVQGYFIIHGLKGMLSPSGVPILTLSNNLQFLALLATLVTAVFVLLFLAEMVTRYGVGNGISLLILSGTCFSLFDNVLKFIDHTNELQQNFFCVVVFAVVVIFLFIFIPIVLVKTTYTIPLKHSSDESSSDFLKLSSCLSGKEVIGYATSLLMLPATIFSFMGGFESFATSLQPGSFAYYFFSCILVIFLSYIFGWLFLSPIKRFKTLKLWGWSLEGNQSFLTDSMKQKFLFMNLPWTIFLCAVLVLPSITITGFNIPFYLGGASLIVVAVISLDVVSRFRLWHENVYDKTYKIAEFQDLYHATMIKNHLVRENIKFYLQGYYHRHLLYFFGPYIPINLMAPAYETDRVIELITRYYGGLGLKK